MKFTKLVAIMAIAASFIACNNKKSETTLETRKDSTSYALGALQAQGYVGQIKQMQAMKYVDNDMFLKAVDEALNEKPLLDMQQALNVIQNTFRQIQMDSTFTMPEASKGGAMQNIADSFSYAFGANMTGSINKSIEELQLSNDISKDAMYGGIEDVIRDSSIIDEQTSRTLVNEIVQKGQAAKMKANEEKFADNKKAGEDFLEENKKRDGVKTTESGLQYEVIKKGTGASPAATDKVKVHYHGTLIDGSVFDSSVDRGEPITFPLNQVIAGWTEGVQLMKEGAKYKFYIPQDLAYGGQDKGQIKPFSTLVFEVELLEVVE